MRSDELIIKKLRKLYEVSQEEYTLKEITRDATILAGFTFVAGTCVMYPVEVYTILNHIFG